MQYVGHGVQIAVENEASFARATDGFERRTKVSRIWWNVDQPVQTQPRHAPRENLDQFLVPHQTWRHVRVCIRGTSSGETVHFYAPFILTL